MKSLTHKLTTAIAAAFATIVALGLAGLWLSVLAFMALFALAAIGTMAVAAPFMGDARRKQDVEAEVARDGMPG